MSLIIEFISAVVVVGLFLVPVCSSAQTVDFAILQQKMMAYAHELKVAEVAIAVSEQRLKGARAAYYPTLDLHYSNEWFDDLAPDNNDLDSVAGTVISSSGSGWKNVLGLSLQYTLFDGGLRRQASAVARRNVDIARLTRKQQEIDQVLELLEFYVAGLRHQAQISHRQVVLSTHQQIYRLKQRLHDAGQIDRLQLGEAAIAVTEATDRLVVAQHEWADVVSELSFLCGEIYDNATLHLAPLVLERGEIQCDRELLPEIQAYQLMLENKLAEYQRARSRYSPRFIFYSNYNFYGSDTADWSQALSRLRQRSFSCGITIGFNLFNGFADQAEIKLLRLEAEQLKLQRDQRIAEHEKTLSSLHLRKQQVVPCRENWSRFSSEQKSQAEMAQRLADEQLSDQVTVLSQHLTRESKNLNLFLHQLDLTEDLYRLRVLSSTSAVVATSCFSSLAGGQL